jgi:glycosyltransferase 2 family protein
MHTFFDKVFKRIRQIDRRLAAALMLLLSLAVMGWLVYRQRDSLATIHWKLTQTGVWNLILFFLLFSLDLLLVAAIWGWIMNSLGIRISLSRHIAYYSVSNIAKRIPGTIWYIAGRGYFYNSLGVSAAIVPIASTIELAVSVLSGLLASIIFAFPQLLGIHANPWIIAGLSLLCLLAFHPKILRWFLTKFRGNTDISYRYSSLVAWVGLYIIAWILGGLVLFTLIGAFLPISFNQIPFVIGCWCLTGLVTSAFFFFPSNLGVTEVTLSLLLSNVIPSADAVVIAILMRIALTGFELLWAVLSAIYLQQMGVRFLPKSKSAALSSPNLHKDED